MSDEKREEENFETSSWSSFQTQQFNQTHHVPSSPSRHQIMMDSLDHSPSMGSESFVPAASELPFIPSSCSLQSSADNYPWMNEKKTSKKQAKKSMYSIIFLLLSNVICQTLQIRTTNFSVESSERKSMCVIKSIFIPIVYLPVLSSFSAHLSFAYQYQHLSFNTVF